MDKEKDLLSGARRLDKAIIAEIYDEYSPGIYRYVVKQLGDANLAEDCVADTFSRFLQALKKKGGPSKHLKAYLYRISHNWVTDHFRRQPPPTSNIEDEALLDPSAGPGSIFESKIAGAEIRNALSKLTTEQSQVLTLKFLDGWSNSEISAAMEKPVGAVKALQHRGLANLRKLLKSNETVNG